MPCQQQLGDLEPIFWFQIKNTNFNIIRRGVFLQKAFKTMQKWHK